MNERLVSGLEESTDCHFLGLLVALHCYRQEMVFPDILAFSPVLLRSPQQQDDKLPDYH